MCYVILTLRAHGAIKMDKEQAEASKTQRGFLCVETPSDTARVTGQPTPFSNHTSPNCQHSQALEELPGPSPKLKGQSTLAL